MAVKNHSAGLSMKYALFLLACWVYSSVSAQSSNLQITAATDLPADFSAEIDIVFVYSQSVLNQLPFEQFGWISTRDELIARFADDIDVLPVVVSAGFTAMSLPLPANHGDAVAVLVFASHEDPVAEGLDISGATYPVLRVESWGVAIE